jgi:hypothetical protein
MKVSFALVPLRGDPYAKYSWLRHYVSCFLFIQNKLKNHVLHCFWLENCTLCLAKKSVRRIGERTDS